MIPIVPTGEFGVGRRGNLRDFGNGRNRRNRRDRGSKPLVAIKFGDATLDLGAIGYGGLTTGEANITLNLGCFAQVNITAKHNNVALDLAVSTDREKIKTVIDTAVTAVENEDTGTIAQLLAQDYKDSAHRSKDAIVRRFRALLHPPLVEDIYDSILEMQISGDTASVTLLNRIFIDSQSNYAEFTRIVLVKVEIDLRKTPDGNWLITRTEIQTINSRPATWSNVNYENW